MQKPTVESDVKRPEDGRGSVSETVGAALGATKTSMPVSGGPDLDHIFQDHAPSGEQLAQYGRLRSAARDFAIAIVQNSPAGADQSAAIRHVREAVMTANAAIALGGRLDVVAKG